MNRHRTQSTFSSMEKLFIAAGIVAVVGLIAFAIVRTNRRAQQQAEAPPVAAMPAPQPAPVDDHDHAAEATIPRMNVAQLKAAIDAGTAVVIDVRDVNSYMAGHIPGAFHIPLEFIESQTPYMPRGKTIVSYCTWPAEESSARAALIMRNKGITDVAALVGGLDAWRNEGHEIATGASGQQL